ncbi:aspartate aminotransferase family protein, partial [Candidatus Geothermarchaeota archaeon]
NEYIDFSSGWASNNVGNVHPEVLEAVIDALKKYGFIYNHPLAFELAEKLVEITPENLTRVTLEVSGTEAAEAAVSYALTAREKPLIISFMGSYHGDSIGARIIGAHEASRKKYFEAMQGGVLFVPYPRTYKIPSWMTPDEYTDFILWYIDELLLEYISDPDRIAGVLFEPMMAEGGNYIPPRRFFVKLRELADKYNWFLICDEVLTGFGRTGKFWGIEHYGTKVDAIVTAKGLTGGLVPNGAVVMSDGMAGEKRAYSGSTFAGCPAGCAAALKTIEIIYRDNLLDYVSRMGEEALKVMKTWPEKYDIIVDSRGIGFLLATSVETGKGDELDVEIARRIFIEAKREGVWPIWDDEPHIRIYPPLNIEEELLFKGLEGIERAIKRVEEEYKAGLIKPISIKH